MKQPYPDHPITVELGTRRVRVLFNGFVVADTIRALELREAGHAMVRYIPREDADMRLLRRSDHETHCPYKGEASHFTIVADGREAENAVCSYEHPFRPVAAIAWHLAFYPDRVDAIEVLG